LHPKGQCRRTRLELDIVDFDNVMLAVMRDERRCRHDQNGTDCDRTDRRRQGRIPSLKGFHPVSPLVQGFATAAMRKKRMQPFGSSGNVDQWTQAWLGAWKRAWKRRQSGQSLPPP